MKKKKNEKKDRKMKKEMKKEMKKMKNEKEIGRRLITKIIRILEQNHRLTADWNPVLTRFCRPD